MLLNDLLFSFQGRINRQTFWLAYLGTVGVVLFLILLVSALALLLVFLRGSLTVPGFGAIHVLLIVLIGIPSFMVTLALGAKRLHDRGKSGWWLILYWVLGSLLGFLGYYLVSDNTQVTFGYILQGVGGLLNLLGLIDMGFGRGTVGPNVYGPDPSAGAN